MYKVDFKRAGRDEADNTRKFGRKSEPRAYLAEKDEQRGGAEEGRSR